MSEIKLAINGYAGSAILCHVMIAPAFVSFFTMIALNFCSICHYQMRHILADIKDSLSYHFSAQAPKRDFSIPVAIVRAVGLHALTIFGISFSMDKDPASIKSM